jgi:hypothetical protein
MSEPHLKFKKKITKQFTKHIPSHLTNLVTNANIKEHSPPALPKRRFFQSKKSYDETVVKPAFQNLLHSIYTNKISAKTKEIEQKDAVERDATVQLIALSIKEGSPLQVGTLRTDYYEPRRKTNEEHRAALEKHAKISPEQLVFLQKHFKTKNQATIEAKLDEIYRNIKKDISNRRYYGMPPPSHYE